MDDLIAFITARLDEDEQAAHDAKQELGGAAGWWIESETIIAVPYKGPTGQNKGIFTVAQVPDGKPVTAHIARHDPARVLREVEAKRRMVDECAATIRQGLSVGLAETMLVFLALPYADHVDYRKEWRP